MPAGLLRLVFGVFVSCALLGAARAEEPASLLDRILARGALRVGTTGDYKPFTWRNPETGEFEGVDIEQAESFAAALGVKVEFVQTAWPTLAADFEAGKFDVAMGGVSVTFERARKGYFSIPYLREGKTPIARCGEVQRFGEIAEIDRPEVRVVVNPGGTNERFARAHFKTAPIRIFPDNRAIFDEIAAGRADVMVTDVSETKFQARLHPGVLCPVHPDKPFDFAEKAYWMPRDAALKAFVDTWLHMSLASGGFAAITRKWMD
ncbi:MAG TPA: transporter substrate-binding domain-containing protein [Rhodoblastus sp.]|nr:transporter substrate-binding domain-containing protein [Rhodoblastus sp.]